MPSMDFQFSPIPYVFLNFWKVEFGHGDIDFDLSIWEEYWKKNENSGAILISLNSQIST